jgi:hypothetical protein
LSHTYGGSANDLELALAIAFKVAPGNTAGYARFNLFTVSTHREFQLTGVGVLWIYITYSRLDWIEHVDFNSTEFLFTYRILWYKD